MGNEERPVSDLHREPTAEEKREMMSQLRKAFQPPPEPGDSPAPQA